MPAEKVLQQKQEKVAALVEKIKSSVAAVLVDYKGITVEDDTKLRKELREAGVQYSVVKNSTLDFALKATGFESITDCLEGSTAIALSEGDQTAAARIIGKYAKSIKDGTFAMKAGFVEGNVFDAKGLEALSKIPSKDVLLSQLVGSLQGPITGLACIVKAVADKKSEEAA
ncbi:MAG: 50S ribosomal protein L10 [Oscillospiraceae bacterium]